jgi:dihydrofolate reductase
MPVFYNYYSGRGNNIHSTGRNNVRKIFVFTNVSLDGYFEGPGHDISGFKNDFEAFSGDQSQEVDTLLFGRKTYDMMKFWSTPQAQAMAPQIAKFMNEKAKVVASHESFEPGWSNVTVISTDVAGAVKTLKEQPGKTIAMFGSNNLCVNLLQAGLIDELQIMVNPVVFGEGTSLFAGLPKKAELTLTETRQFKNGTVLLTYAPVQR